MPRTDKSNAILTGMIIAALYVILLVGFAQESYMRRDAASRTDELSRAPTNREVSKRACEADLPLCAALFSDLSEQYNCVVSIDAVRRYLSEPVMPLTQEGIRRAMREEP